MKRAPRYMVTVQRNTPAPNLRGETVDVWVTLSNVFMDLHQLSGREQEAAFRVNSEVDWRGYMRFTPGLIIKPRDRVIYQSHTLDIVSVIDLHELHQTIQLDMKEQATP